MLDVTDQKLLHINHYLFGYGKCPYCDRPVKETASPMDIIRHVMECSDNEPYSYSEDL